jgi:hypothetical protein
MTQFTSFAAYGCIIFAFAAFVVGIRVARLWVLFSPILDGLESRY